MTHMKRVDTVSATPFYGPAPKPNEALWKATARKVAQLFETLKSVLQNLFGIKNSQEISKSMASKVVSPTLDEVSSLLSHVSTAPPEAQIVQDVVEVASPILAPASIQEKTPVVLQGIVMNVVDMVLEAMAATDDPIKKGVCDWIRVAARDKTSTMGHSLGEVFAKMDNAFLFDQMIQTVSQRFERVVAERHERDALAAQVAMHKEALESRFLSVEDRDASLQFFAETFQRPYHEVDDRAIAEEVARRYQTAATVDVKPFVQELLAVLDLQKPLSEVSPAEKESRQALLEAVASQLGLEVKDLESVLNIEGANTLIEKALENQLNQVFVQIFSKLGSQSFINNLFGQTIIPKITEALQDQLKYGPEPQPKEAVVEHHVPLVYKELASNICALAGINPADMVFNGMLAGIIANSIYEYRHSPLLMNQVMDQLAVDYADKAAFNKEMASTEASDQLMARVLSLPNVEELRARFEYNLELRKREIFTGLRSQLSSLPLSQLEALALQQAEAERETAFIEHTIKTVIEPQIAKEKGAQASQAVKEMVTAAITLVDKQIEAKSSLVGWAFSWFKAPIQNKLTHKVEGIFHDVFGNEEANTALVNNIAQAMIRTMQEAKNPSQDLGHAVDMM